MPSATVRKASAINMWKSMICIRKENGRRLLRLFRFRTCDARILCTYPYFIACTPNGRPDIHSISLFSVSYSLLLRKKRMCCSLAGLYYITLSVNMMVPDDVSVVVHLPGLVVSHSCCAFLCRSVLCHGGIVTIMISLSYMSHICLTSQCLSGISQRRFGYTLLSSLEQWGQSA